MDEDNIPEDISGDVDPFAIAEDEPSKAADPDQSNKSVLIEVSKEISQDIARHNTFNVITLPANAKPEEKIAAFDEMAIHKGLALHLQKYQLMIDNKIKEL